MLWLLLIAPWGPLFVGGDAEAPVYETVVRDHPDASGDPDTSQRELDAQQPGLATAVDLTTPQGARSADALPEVLTRTPGAAVRSIGGLGQYSSISLRGSSSQQVAIFLDGVPVDASIAGLVDLSALPLDTLARLEIYRGHIPVQMGSAAIGGAINLVGLRHRGAPRTLARVGFGSFGSRELQLSHSRQLDPHQSLAVRVGYAGATGDFPFFDDNGTYFNPDDDAIRRRLNNGYDRLLTQLRLDGRRGAWRYGAQQITLLKTQGLPGLGRAQSRNSRLDTVTARLIGHARRSILGPGGELTLLGAATWDRSALHDPDTGSLGLGSNEQQSDGLDLFFSPTVRMPLWPQAFVTLTGDLRYQRHQSESPATPFGGGSSLRRRDSMGLGVQLDQHGFGGRLHLAMVHRLDSVTSRFAVPAGRGRFNDKGEDSQHQGWSPRAAVRITTLPWLQLRVSGGRYTRTPSLMELFGDQGFLVGNEGLRPEQGTAIDGGVVVDTGEGPFALYAQVAGFATWSEDLILWQMTASRVRPRNLSSAEVAGLETGISARAWDDLLRLQANYTFMHSSNGSDDPSAHGKPLPGRPAHQLFVRAAAATRWHGWWGELGGEIFYTTELIGGSYLDSAARREAPLRNLQGAGLVLHLRPHRQPGLEIRLAGEVRNLLDQIVTQWRPPAPATAPIPVPVSDFIGYPLPGRSVWFTLTIAASPSQVDPT